MDCPSCKGYNLKPTKLDFGLSAHSCSNCNGLLINLLNYRDWLESVPELLSDINYSPEVTRDNEHALLCNKCSRIMLKFKISSQTSNHIDVCSYCYEAWLDSGEWDLLKFLSIHKDLTKIFTEPWQTRISSEIEDRNFENRFEDLLGLEDYNRLKEFKGWIRSHEKSRDLLRYLQRESKSS